MSSASQLMAGSSSTTPLRAYNLCISMVWFMAISVLFVDHCCAVHLTYCSLYYRKTSYSTREIAFLPIPEFPNFFIHCPHSPLRLQSPKLGLRNYLMARRHGITSILISIRLELPCIRYFCFCFVLYVLFVTHHHSPLDSRVETSGHCY